MRIVLTGGAGFIGSNFVKFAIDNDAEVYNYDKLTYAGNLANLAEYLKHPNHTFIKDDICNRKEFSKIVSDVQPDAIVHMAAESHVDRSIDCADEFILTNVVGTHTILDVSLEYWKSLSGTKKDQFRMLHLSTDEVFGALGKTGRFNEASPYKPNSPYAASKASSDLLVRSYIRTYGLPALITNSSNNYGPNQYSEKLIPLTTLNAIEEKPLPVYGNGQQMRDWLYVGDHVRALWKILKEGHIGEQYCVGGNSEQVNLDVVQMICGILDDLKPRPSHKSYKDLIMFVKDRPGHDFRYAIDASKLKEHTNWVPETVFAEGLKLTVQWYLEYAGQLLEVDGRQRAGLRLVP